jgi:putative FmdB family regulatory protein
MPLYEFSCKQCGSISEHLMSISSENPSSCEKCQGGPLVKLLSRSNFALKGSGWYETDFKRKQNAPASCPMADSTSSESASACPPCVPKE